ncbi:AAA family ATPase [Frankia sp. R82]|nr:AAA family ATPase [Frankia sp. R82]
MRLAEQAEQAELVEPSAFGQVAQLELEIDGVARQVRHFEELLRELVRTRDRWAAGGRGEQSVVRVLVGMVDVGWQVLADRRWPGTRKANIDVIVVGPGGVFVVDVKNWREFGVEGGRLWRGQADADDSVRKLLEQTTAVEDVVAEAGLPPTEVVPLLVMAGRRGLHEQLDRVAVLGQQDLTGYLLRQGVRLGPEPVERLLECLDQGCPPMPRDEGRRPGGSTPARTHGVTASPRDTRANRDRGAARTPTTPTTRTTPPSHPAPVTPPVPAVPAVPAVQMTAAVQRTPAALETLPGMGELWQDLLVAAAREPVESWMTWLHPSQARLAGRRWSGPARVRGAAGTGKTVVALHRAKYLAARGDRVLFTSLVSTLGPVNRALLARMAPEHVARVDFVTVHQFARRCLEARGLSGHVEKDRVRLCFRRAWAQVGRHSVLSGLGLPLSYWQEEISKVIKGRGLRGFEQYATLSRVGRSTALQPVHRRAVWDLYERYETLRIECDVLDFDDLLLLARDLVRASGPSGAAGVPGPSGGTGRYDAVIVDEVQDLTCVGLQLLHALVGDRPDGLLVVGDGQQSIYPGGFTLAEAGVSVVGRSTVLGRNYRNGANILRYAQAVLADDGFDDLDGVEVQGRRPVDVERAGGEVCEERLPSAAAQDERLCDDLLRLHTERGARFGDMAVLVPTDQAVERWLTVLRRRQIPAMALRAYDGSRQESVKVGTYARVKSLDFAHVWIPDRDLFPRPRKADESDDALRERLRLERRQLYVAITRARDRIWAGLRTTSSEIVHRPVFGPGERP